LQAKFWFNVWKDCGQPKQGVINQIHKSTKRAFADTLDKHCKNRVEETSAKVRQNPNELWKLVPKLAASTTSPASTGDILALEWYAHFELEFFPPDVGLKWSFEQELDTFLAGMPPNDFVVLLSTV
jgi:hypothetical protein